MTDNHLALAELIFKGFVLVWQEEPVFAMLIPDRCVILEDDNTGFLAYKAPIQLQDVEDGEVFEIHSCWEKDKIKEAWISLMLKVGDDATILKQSLHKDRDGASKPSLFFPGFDIQDFM